MLAGADRRAARRADTAGKFKLGGLIVLAGLRDLPESVLAVRPRRPAPLEFPRPVRECNRTLLEGAMRKTVSYSYP
jgi:hypothetical protein